MRSILHCDLNAFFASVECLKRPELKNVPMAVCGDPKLRHGIILAKNELAKKYGIYTPETVYSAKKKCPNLVLVEPHYKEYIKYSKLVNQIYLKYTDRVEPFSIDESYLDVTESKNLFGNSYQIAYAIKEEVKEKLGLTISVGVSFNKVFAKIGSDMKKPDAITIIDKDHFQKILYSMPVETMLFVGKSTKEKLKKMRIYTIGDLANYDVTILIKKLGKNGLQLFQNANGMGEDIVSFYREKKNPKSIGKGITLPKDINEKEILMQVIRKLANEVAQELRKHHLTCKTVCLSIKDSNFYTFSRQKSLFKTDLYQDISRLAMDIFLENYLENRFIRTVTLTVSNLEKEGENQQLDIFSFEKENQMKEEKLKLERVSQTLDRIREKYGNQISFGSTIK